ncbi:MAG: Uma2 family endonuclease [Synechococcaceae cyanobacterium SM2_3_2]|nr:Uma2 family endonuclease [Synechococcaceae cyanobacterium SM2_3_2]
MQLQDKVRLQNIHLWSVEDYHRMIENGLLTHDDRVELLEGIVSQMSPKGVSHVIISRWIAERFRERLGVGSYLLTQDPITLTEQGSEPEPDITIARGSMFDYTEHHPYPEDILLVIEVADSSIEIDKTIKMPIYARARIQDYWVVDIKAKEITIYRQPVEDSYQAVQAVTGRDRLSPLAFPEIAFQVQDLFPQGR